jgi:hypothetical protein
MKSLQSGSVQWRFVLATRLALPTIAIFLGACGSPSYGEPGNDNRAPDVPDAIKVPVGNKVHFHAYAVGVQIYAWTINPTNGAGSWVFRAPEAVLFADADTNGEIGIHYAGPTWESESGSKVVAARVAGVTVEATAIPWLLLKATGTEGPGILNRTAYVQRVNTVGGLAPSTPGTAAGQEARVPYIAEYFFYREQKQ